MNKSFSLPLHDISVGGILTEASRATLHTANPSAFVSRLIEGVAQHRAEMVNQHSADDRSVFGELLAGLHVLRDHMRRVEEAAYPPPNP